MIQIDLSSCCSTSVQVIARPLFDLCHILLHFTLHLPPVSSLQFSLQCSHLSTKHSLCPALPHPTTKSTHPLSSQMTHQVSLPPCLIPFAVGCPVIRKHTPMTVQSLSQLLPESRTIIFTFEIQPNSSIALPFTGSSHADRPIWKDVKLVLRI